MLTVEAHVHAQLAMFMLIKNWVEKTGEAEQMEQDMLDFAFDVTDQSRLSCQIKISDELDGLIVNLPEKQF